MTPKNNVNMGDSVAETAHLNVSPTGFRLWAQQFYACRLSLNDPGFSPVPYFLLCHAIELQFKAVHLGHHQRADVKKVKEDYKHDLIKSYEDLPAADRTLSAAQLTLLKQANQIYLDKGFEYYDVRDLQNWPDRKAPDLAALDALAAVIMTTFKVQEDQ